MPVNDIFIIFGINLNHKLHFIENVSAENNKFLYPDSESFPKFKHFFLCSSLTYKKIQKDVFITFLSNCEHKLTNESIQNHNQHCGGN